MAGENPNSAILSKAMRDLLMAWEQTQIGWRDQARTDFEKNYIDELRSSVKAALDAMTAIGEFLGKARYDCR
jgi:hypothetical protein